MKQHLRSVHQGDRPKYACHVCEEKYFKGSDLTKHLVKAHSFSWPSGHSRFRYTKDPTSGLFRLQTIRFESVDLQKELQGAASVGVLSMEASPPSVYSQATDWDLDSVQSYSSPLSVQSCPEFGPFQHQQVIDMQPWSVQPCLDEIDLVEGIEIKCGVQEEMMSTDSSDH